MTGYEFKICNLKKKHFNQDFGIKLIFKRKTVYKNVLITVFCLYFKRHLLKRMYLSVQFLAEIRATKLVI